MNRFVLEKWCAWGIKALLFVTPFLSLYISRSLFFPYITGRNFAFRFLVEAALVLYAVLVVLDAKRYVPRRSSILLALGGFLLVLGLADMLGVNPMNSFWSRYERMEGLVMMLHLAAYFVLLVSVFKKERSWTTFFHLFLASGFVVGIYGLLQKAGTLVSLQGGSRIDATIGNPTYLAAYILFMLGIALFFLVRSRHAILRWIYGALSIYFLVVLYFTASRGPLLAVLISAFLFPITYLIWGRKGDAQARMHTKIAIAVLVISVIVPMGFLAIKNTEFVSRSPVLSRFANLSANEKTTRSRFLVWQMSWEGVKERPILGWGQENYFDVFAKHYIPRMYDQEPFFDRAHNIVFDWLVNAGFLGLIAYLALFVSAYMAIARAFKEKKLSFMESSIIGFLLLAYFIQNLFVFDSINTYVLFFTFLAYLHAHAEFTRDEKENARVNGSSSALVVRAAGVGALALVVMSGVAYVANIRPIRESQSLIDVLRLLSAQVAPSEVLAQFDKTLAYRTFGDGEVIEQFSRLATDLVRRTDVGTEQKSAFVTAALSALEDQAKRNPRDLKVRLASGALYNVASPLDPTYLDKGKEHIEKAIEISPGRQSTYFLLADNLLIRNDGAGALQALGTAVDLEPSNVLAQTNLAYIALNVGQGQIADAVLENLKEHMSPDNHATPDAAALVRVGDFYISQQRFDKALPWYELAVRVDVGKAQYRANIAGLYLNLGNILRAIEEANAAKALDPSLAPQVDEFIKKISS